MVDKNLLPQFPNRTFSDIWYNIKLSVRMVYKFFYAIWWFRGSNYNTTYEILLLCLKEHLISMEKDTFEIEESKKPKEIKLKRAIELLENKINDNYSERCGYDHDYDLVFVKNEMKDENGESLYELKSNASDEQNKKNDDALKNSRILEKKEWKEFTGILNDEMNKWWT